MNPSPQMSLQTEAVETSPKVQVQPVSTVHVELHPSPFSISPSSHWPEVGVPTTPSPQLSIKQIDESVELRVCVTAQVWHCVENHVTQVSQLETEQVVSQTTLMVTV